MDQSKNNNRTGMAVAIGKLQEAMDNVKKDIGKLEKGQENIEGILIEIKSQVAVNKTKLGIFATLAGLGGGLIAVLIKILVT